MGQGTNRKFFRCARQNLQNTNVEKCYNIMQDNAGIECFGALQLHRSLDVFLCQSAVSLNHFLSMFGPIIITHMSRIRVPQHYKHYAENYVRFCIYSCDVTHRFQCPRVLFARGAFIQTSIAYNTVMRECTKNIFCRSVYLPTIKDDFQ